MAQYLPLPDELLHKVLGYILPIFEYAEYIRNMKGYNTTQLDMTFICQDCQDMLYGGSAAIKLANLDELTSIGELQKKYLLVAKTFIENNPRFVRPGRTDELSSNQYFRTFDDEVAPNNMERMEKNIHVRRGVWEYPDTKREILLIHDIPEILFHGTTRDLIYSCIVNNIREFRGVLTKYLRREPVIHEIVRFINEKYINMDLCAGGESFRKGLVRSLMRI